MKVPPYWGWAAAGVVAAGVVAGVVFVAAGVVAGVVAGAVVCAGDVVVVGAAVVVGVDLPQFTANNPVKIITVSDINKTFFIILSPPKT
jgi:hypothetical protein